MNNSHHHSAVAEGRVLGIRIQHGGSGLIEHGSGGLVHCGDVGGVGWWRRARVVRHLGTTRLIAREVVARQQYWFQCGMIGIHTGINISDDAPAHDVERGLSRGHAHNVCRGLAYVTIPHG